MRHDHHAPVIATALMLAALLVAPAVRAEAPAGATATPVVPPASTTAEPPAPRSAAIAITLEAVSPIGAVGCFYRRRWLPGALVTLGTVLTGSMFSYGIATQNRDATIINAVAYGVTRAIGIAAAARPDTVITPTPPADPAPRAPSAFAPARTLAFSYVLAF
jgi:hypothetical protein